MRWGGGLLRGGKGKGRHEKALKGARVSFTVASVLGRDDSSASCSREGWPRPWGHPGRIGERKSRRPRWLQLRPERKKAKKPSAKKALRVALGLAGVAAAGIVYNYMDVSDSTRRHTRR